MALFGQKTIIHIRGAFVILKKVPFGTVTCFAYAITSNRISSSETGDCPEWCIFKNEAEKNPVNGPIREIALLL